MIHVKSWNLTDSVSFICRIPENYCDAQRNQYVQDSLGSMAAANLSAFVVGSTGEVGKAIVKELARTPGFSRVTLIARKQVELPKDEGENVYSKFDQKLVDFDKLSENHAEDFKGYDVGFCALGTTRGKSGREGFIKVDHDYVMSTGKLAKEGGCKHFNLVSAGGTNKNSFFLYPQVKGQVEEEMQELGFPRLTIWKPNILLVDRAEPRFFEKIAQAVTGALDRYRLFSIDVPVLAKVMVNRVFEPQTSPVEMVSNREVYHKGLELS